MDCFITRTGSYLPGQAVGNEKINCYLGELEGEQHIKDQILQLNGIKCRYYALDEQQQKTHDIYELATLAAKNCLSGYSNFEKLGLLSVGTTFAPLTAPGIASIVHSSLKKMQIFDRSLEVNSNSGICSSAAQGLVNAIRAIQARSHTTALCIGTEQPSDILKSTAISLIENPPENSRDISKSRWYMQVFLRFMLSDGAGALLLENKPETGRISYRVNWVSSQSFANETPLCMHLDGYTRTLSQNLEILSTFLIPCARKAVIQALNTHEDDLEEYEIVLPHLSSFYFKRKVQAIVNELSKNKEVGLWTNLAHAGNTGSASIFILLDEFHQTNPLPDGAKILLFIPESGQFNFVIISLTVIHA